MSVSISQLFSARAATASHSVLHRSAMSKKATTALATADKAKEATSQDDEDFGTAGALSKKTLDALYYNLKKLKKQGKPEVGVNYKQLANNKDRREFALRLQLDPTGGKCMLMATSDMSIDNTSKVAGDDLALWEITGLNNLVCDEANAATMSFLNGLAAGCPCKPHAQHELASKGLQALHVSHAAA